MNGIFGTPYIYYKLYRWNINYYITMFDSSQNLIYFSYVCK